MVHWLIKLRGWFYLVSCGEIEPLWETSEEEQLIEANLIKWVNGQGHCLNGRVDIVRFEPTSCNYLLVMLYLCSILVVHLKWSRGCLSKTDIEKDYPISL